MAYKKLVRAQRMLELPGGDLIAQGLSDLRQRAVTIPALLVAVGAPRLRRLGIEVPEVFETPEHQLYGMLAEDDPATAHGRYNALVRRLVSFERAAECARSARERSQGFPDAMDATGFRQPGD